MWASKLGASIDCIDRRVLVGGGGGDMKYVNKALSYTKNCGEWRRKLTDDRTVCCCCCCNTKPINMEFL